MSSTYEVPDLTRDEVRAIRDRDPRPADCPSCRSGYPVPHWPVPSGCRSSFRASTGRLYRVHCTCDYCW
ncbi:hypothetical protein [Streptomyces olivaceus]|uniref:hypothetical protein n=1 Tax=Streptomyces olivaceus TaxID=47716 RepID=UPI00364133B2